MKRLFSIDMYLTGQRIKEEMKKHGYTVRMLQEELGLACPQSIYKWFYGQALPSLDIMYALCILFEVHAEELIIPLNAKNSDHNSSLPSIPKEQNNG